MKDRSEYAGILKRVAQIALERWKESLDEYPTGHEGIDGVLIGKRKAYGVILYHITGVSCPDRPVERWQEYIDAM